jgi:hypothetical protein
VEERVRPRIVAVTLGVIGLTSIVSVAAGQTEKPARPTFAFLGTVDMQKSDVPKDMPLVPVTFDARFVIRVRIDRILAGEAPWKQGTTVAFLIHSPARMFGRYDVKGEQFRFTFAVEQGTVAKRDCRYCITDLARAEGKQE